MKRLLSYFLCLLLLAHPCAAARGFGTTFGVGTTDAVQTATLAYPTVISVSCWIYINSSTTSSVAARIYDTGTSPNSLISFTSTTPVFQYGAGFTTTQGVWTITPPSKGVWHHLLVTFDGSSVSN